MAAKGASEEDYSKILDFLYIGSKNVARDKEKLLSLGVTHVVNCTVVRNEGGCHNYFENEPQFRYLRCPVQDSDAASLKKYFGDTCKFIEGARKLEHGVLVHCQQGVSRSSTITIAYLMKSQKMSLIDAYNHVKTRRPVVKPKKNFLCELLQFEKELKEGSDSKGKKDEKPGEKRKKESKEISAPKRSKIGPTRPNSGKEEAKVENKPKKKKRIGPMRPPGV
mmetsp:Transcript_12475/g.18618  ORF Transcript_12475/g.18618 Transcript_12475/m.18618 type:complete len:222 (-) Transcript_12475:19-684(-)